MTSVSTAPSKQDAVHRFKNQVHLLSQTVNGTGREGFDRDFEELEKFDEEMRKDAMRFYSSTLPHNRHKNRYHDIMPNQHTMCMVCGERPESDRYFNGNYVCPPGNFQNYICCQAPLSNTCGDFWNVVWYYEVKVVVMLCSEIENGRKKSERYWPLAIGEKIHYDHFDVILKNEETRPHLIVRTLLVTNSLFQEDDAGRSRIVYHYQYTGWPDFGVPEGCESILDLMRSVDKVNQAAPGDSKKHPILVHCSAGVGRTGTYVAIHTAIDHFKDGRDFSIFYIVKNLKEQRCGMVQRKEQYKFAFLAALHELERMVSQSYPLQPAKSDNALANSSSLSLGSDTASLSSFGSNGALMAPQGSGLNLAMPTVSIPQSPASPTTNPYPLGPHTPLSRVGSASVHPLSAPVTPANGATGAPFAHPGLAQHPGAVGPPTGPTSPPAVAAPVMPNGGLGTQTGSWQQYPGMAETARAPMSPPMMHHQIPHSAPSTPLGGPPHQQPHPNFDVNGVHDHNHHLVYRSNGPGLNAQPHGQHPSMHPPPVPVPTPDMMGANPPQPHMPPPPHMKMQGGPHGAPRGYPGQGSADQGQFYAGQPGRGPPPGQPMPRGPPVGKGLPQGYPQRGGPPFRDGYEHGYPHEHPQHRGQHPHQRATSLSPARRPAWSGPDEYSKPYDVPQEYYGPGAGGPRGAGGARKGPPGSLTSPFGHAAPNPGNPQRMTADERGGPTPAYRRRGSGYNRGVGPGYQ